MNNNAVNVPSHIWKCGEDLLHKVFLRIRLHAAFLAVFLIGIKQLCRTGTISGVQLAVILVLFLHGQIIFANKRLENVVVIYVLGRQVSKDVSKLAEKFCGLKTLVQSLPGYIGHVLLSQKHIVQHTEQ